MIEWSWITSTWENVLMVVLSGIGVYLTLLLFTRLSGLRSFSKMSSFDFAITVAMGSLLAATLLTPNPPLLQGMVGLAVLYGMQFVVSSARRKSERVKSWVDNDPLLLMAGSSVLSDHLDEARMTQGDLYSKLRMAGITHPDQLLAVVFESTGDVSVMKKSDQVDFALFDGVRGADQLRRNQ